METPSIGQRIIEYRRRQRRERATRLARGIYWPAGLGGLFILLAGGLVGLAH